MEIFQCWQTKLPVPPKPDQNPLDKRSITITILRLVGDDGEEVFKCGATKDKEWVMKNGDLCDIETAKDGTLLCYKLRA